MSSRTKTRVRVNHAYTQKDGWMPETTVEVEWSGEGIGEEQDEQGLVALGNLIERAREIAYAECDYRNSLKGRPPASRRVDVETGEILE